jgi:hypothetical protein
MHPKAMRGIYKRPLKYLLAESQATKGNLRAEDLFDTVVLLENIHPLGMRSSNIVACDSLNNASKGNAWYL